MKRTLSALLILAVVGLSLFALASCSLKPSSKKATEKATDPTASDEAKLVSANGFSIDGNALSASVSNDTVMFSFVDRITVSARATWQLSTDEQGNDIVEIKAVPLREGDNTFYIFVTSESGKGQSSYVVTIRRAAAEPATEPATDPATEPATDSATEPATEPATDPVTNPVTDPATEPVTEPATTAEPEPDEALIVSATGFSIDGNALSASVSNDTTSFSFVDRITVSERATWQLILDAEGNETVPGKTVSLEEGDNTFYILVTSGSGENLSLYAVTINRAASAPATAPVTEGEGEGLPTGTDPDQGFGPIRYDWPS